MVLGVYPLPQQHIRWIQLVNLTKCIILLGYDVVGDGYGYEYVDGGALDTVFGTVVDVAFGAAVDVDVGGAEGGGATGCS